MSTPLPSQMDPFAGLGGFSSTPAAPYGQQPSQVQGSFANTQSPPKQQQPPMAGYGAQQQQQPYGQQQMVASTQQTNQWGIQGGMQHQQSFNSSSMLGVGYPQQQSTPQGYQQQSMMTPQQPTQQPIPLSSSQSIASSHYMTPNMNMSAAPHSVHSSQPTPQMLSPANSNQSSHPQQQQPYQNAYQNSFVQQQQAQQQQTTSPSAPAPAAPTHTLPAAKVEEDDDFFGDFSNTAKKKHTISPNRPPAEFETDFNESVSVLSKSTNGTGADFRLSSSGSPLDDPKFAPKPPKPQGLDNAIALAHNAPPGSSRLPDFDLVTHSGYALSRISFRTILIKKWKQVFWVTYGVNKLLVFRSSADFEDWVSNPYLNTAQREFLVKLEIDLVEDLKQPSIRGYQVTNQRLKNYNNKMLYQFKVERWMDYGPTIAAAFASPNEREIFNLRTIFSEMLKRSPQDKGVHGTSQGHPNPYNSNAASYQGQPGNPPGHYHNYSSSASTGMYDHGSMSDARSVKSYGVLSTGPVERSTGRDPTSDAIAGYQPTTSRRPFQY